MTVAAHDRFGLALPVKLAALAAAMLLSTSAWAQSGEAPPPILNLYGTPGLLDMPGAHMEPDGTFTLWAAGTGFTQRYGFSFQALPWLEGTFRYIGTRDLYGAQVFDGSTYYDRSFGVRVRLQDETGGWPDVTAGLDDTIGTGLESGEYLAASKHLGPVDVTLGLGWGRLAGTGMFENPFALVFHSFFYRQASTGLVDTSGSLLPFRQFFHGPDASLFGGLSWQTPIDGLSLLVEYSSDNYHTEAQQHVFRPATQVNAGAAYQVTPSLQVGAAFMYGRTPMLHASFSLNPKADSYVQRYGAAPMAPHIRTDDELRRLARATLTNDEPAVQSIEGDGDTLVATVKGGGGNCVRYAQLIATAHEHRYRDVAISDMDDPRGKVQICSAADAPDLLEHRLTELASWHDNAGAEDASFAQARARAIDLAAVQALEIDAIALNGNQVDVAFTNAHYRTEPEAYGRLARVLMATMPENIETFRIISVADGMPTREIVLPRSSLERVIADNGAGSELLALAPTAESNASLDRISQSVVSYPTYDWSLLPEYNQSLFDPNQPYRYQLLAGLAGGISLTRQLRLEGELQANIISDFSDLQPSDSQLPHVRSDTVEYYDKGKNGIAEMQGSYTETLAPGVYALARAGILESMFAGGGGEILWRPDGDRWAVGGTLYEVWQRGFDRLFDLQPYHVLTGHVSIYYESPWYDLDLRLDAGRYLAGDEGATVTVTRRFDTGVEIGLFATLTNVPFAQFGEGSFDKGFIIRIPLDFMIPLNSQSEFDMNLRPVTRDGGQMLEPEQVLYDSIRRTSYGDFLANVDQIPSP